jgi:Capsule polysaccharide biosynthesis protein
MLWRIALLKRGQTFLNSVPRWHGVEGVGMVTLGTQSEAGLQEDAPAASQRTKIVVHGFGTYAILYYHMIAHARTVAPNIEWAMILPTSHHLDVVAGMLDASDILCLEDRQAIRLNAASDLSELGNYSGNLYADIEAAKQVFKHRSGAEQVSRAMEIYSIYKRFLIETKATHLLFAHVETAEGKILVSLAHELGIPAMLPTDFRNLGGMCLSPDTNESLPVYRRAVPSSIQEASHFLAEFRARPKAALNLVLKDDPQDAPLPIFQKPFHRRVWNQLRRTLRNPRLFEASLFAISVKYAFPRTRELIRSLRAARNRTLYDLDDLSQLPAKFIYYPLQTTPESSINTPAPYYVDQMRAIDAIRFAMPSDCVLVVKEHPASIGVRPGAYYKALRRKAGVLVARCDLSSLRLIEQAGLTISVTGTATLEAFLLGRPSLVLGHSFIAEYLGGVCSLHELPERIRRSSALGPTDERIIAALAEIFSVRYPCVFRPADEKGSNATRPENVKRLFAAVKDHIARLAKTGVARVS